MQNEFEPRSGYQENFPFQATEKPIRNGSDISSSMVKEGRVLRISQEFQNYDVPKITMLEVAENAGATPVKLQVLGPRGLNFNLLGLSSASILQKRYQDRLAQKNPFAGNVFFEPGAAAPLFGLANRLTGRVLWDGVIEAKIRGIPVTAPLNHGLGIGERPHHLHGFAYDKSTGCAIVQDFQGIRIQAEFEPGFYKPFWYGKASLQVTHSLENGTYKNWMTVLNEGEDALPMGLGAHPYFLAPSLDPQAIKLRIPGRKLVEVDGYKNVLPTGRIVSIEPGSEFDFRAVGGSSLHRYLDNLWVDLETDENGFAFAEFFDEKARVKFKMTALTKNMIGIQVYSPWPFTNPELGVFAAIEFVTNLPDPRDDLWLDQDTGMKVLKSGERLDYGYKIEVFNL